MCDELDNLTPGQWVSSDWVHSFPYPVQTSHLQLPQDVVLCWPLIHIPYQHLPKLLSAVEVGPVTNTFVLKEKKRRDREKDGERRGRVVGIRQLKEPAHLKQLSNQLIGHTILVSCLPPHPHTLLTHTHTIIPTIHIHPSLLESVNAVKYCLSTENEGTTLLTCS